MIPNFGIPLPENGVVRNFMIDELPEQTSLDFEQTAITDPIIEQRMRYEGVHAEFVSPKETTPTADGQFFFFGR